MFTWLSHLWTYINALFDTKLPPRKYKKFNQFQQQHNSKNARDRRIENSKIAMRRFNSRH